jgi:hypothetical protein
MTPLLVAELNKKHGWGLTIHIDGASGAFVAPFLYPDLKWDFRLPNVSSINASGGMGRDEGEALLLRPAWQRRRASCCCALSSPAGLSQPCHHHHPTRTRTLITTATFQYTPGHKYGLVYPGLGWIVWRDASHLPGEGAPAACAPVLSAPAHALGWAPPACLCPQSPFTHRFRPRHPAPESMVFYENYLGTLERSITLNFSKPATNIVAQYYQFLRLGYSGYRKVCAAGRCVRAVALPQLASHTSSAHPNACPHPPYPRKIMTNLDIIRKRLTNSIERTGAGQGGWACGWVSVMSLLREVGCTAFPDVASIPHPPHPPTNQPTQPPTYPPHPFTGHFEILSKDVGVPVVAFRLKKVEGSDGKQHHRLYDEFALADRLRMRGWVLPGAPGEGAGLAYPELASVCCSPPQSLAAAFLPSRPLSRGPCCLEHSPAHSGHEASL